jgi:hypothetical protein
MNLDTSIIIPQIHEILDIEDTKIFKMDEVYEKIPKNNYKISTKVELHEENNTKYWKFITNKFIISKEIDYEEIENLFTHKNLNNR